MSTTCRVLKPNGVWEEYVPDPNSVLIIAAGFNGTSERLEALGYHTTTLRDPAYDSYPVGWRKGNRDYLMRPLIGRRREAAPGPTDLASYADDAVLPAILALVAAGRGPAAVLAGSRGGQVTVPRLWRMWRGPTVVLNGGCVAASGAVPPPTGVALGLLTQGNDFFPTANPVYTQEALAAWSGPVVLYWHREDNHAVRTFSGAVGLVLAMVLDRAPLTLRPSVAAAAARAAGKGLHGLARGGQVFFKPSGQGKAFDQVWG